MTDSICMDIDQTQEIERLTKEFKNQVAVYNQGINLPQWIVNLLHEVNQTYECHEAQLSIEIKPEHLVFDFTRGYLNSSIGLCSSHEMRELELKIINHLMDLGLEFSVITEENTILVPTYL
jgi:hypothetical protein